MKKIAFVFLLINCFALNTIGIEHKIERATVAMVDILEHVQKNYIPCPPENIEGIHQQIKDLIHDAILKDGESMRLYTFIGLDFRFDTISDNNRSYSFNTLLYVEVDPKELKSLSSENLNQLAAKLTENLIEFYEHKKIGIKKIFKGCYVACVQSGIEEII